MRKKPMSPLAILSWGIVLIFALTLVSMAIKNLGLTEGSTRATTTGTKPLAAAPVDQPDPCSTHLVFHHTRGEVRKQGFSVAIHRIIQLGERHGKPLRHKTDQWSAVFSAPRNMMMTTAKLLPYDAYSQVVPFETGEVAVVHHGKITSIDLCAMPLDQYLAATAGAASGPVA